MHIFVKFFFKKSDNNAFEIFMTQLFFRERFFIFTNFGTKRKDKNEDLNLVLISRKNEVNNMKR